MKPIEIEKLQAYIDQFANEPVYIHLETTNGAYAQHFDSNAYNVGAYIRNASITFVQGKVVEQDQSYRIGLKHEIGWIYAEGLTDFEYTEEDQLLIAGHDREGRLMVTLEISRQPFAY